MFIIEIILTIFVWRKGWRWLALLPIGIALLIGFIIGISVGMAGGTPTTGGGIIFIDILAIIALIIMLIKGPKDSINEKEKE